MEDQHLTPELLDALIRYELPPLVLSGLVWNHLLSVCPGCAEGVEAWKAKVSGRPSYDEAFTAAQRRLEDELALRARAQAVRRAKRELQELLRAAPEDRLSKVLRGTKRFQSVALADLLLEECVGRLHDDPWDALGLARLARQVAGRSNEPGCETRAISAQAWIGNCLRATGQLAEATARLHEARRKLQETSVVDSLVYAELDLIEGVLLKDRRSLDEAEKLLSRSKLVYRLDRQPVSVNRALIALADVHGLQGRLDEALNDLHEAMESIDPEEQPRLYLIAGHNLATYYYERGEIEAARRLVEEMRPKYDRCGDQTIVLRRIWLEGRIARGEERLEEAERHLRHAAAGFEELEIGYDTALVALDLAELYLFQGKTAAVKTLAESIRPTFVFNDLHQEAIAALTLFQNAAARELATTSMLERLRERLEDLRARPRVATGVEA